MTNRKLSLISQTIVDLLVKQLAHELKNRNLYLSFANYFIVNGIDDLAEYYKKRAVFLCGFRKYSKRYRMYQAAGY